MKTSLLIIHNASTAKLALGKYLRVRGPADPVRTLDDGYMPAQAEYVPEKEIGVEHHGPAGVTRSTQTQAEYIKVAGWHFPIEGGVIAHERSSASRLMVLRHADVMMLSIQDQAIQSLQEKLNLAVIRRQEALSEMAKRAHVAQLKDVVP